jgi:hypothetical protein
MSVQKTWFKLSLTQSLKAADGSLSSLKLGELTLTPEVGVQLGGSTIEFEFVKIEATSPSPETLSLTQILIGL